MIILIMRRNIIPLVRSPFLWCDHKVLGREEDRQYLHCLITDGAYEEQGDGELRFLAAPPPTPERMTAVLAQVHEVIRAADDDLDPTLAACSSRSPARTSRPAHSPRRRR